MPEQLNDIQSDRDRIAQARRVPRHNPNAVGGPHAKRGPAPTVTSPNAPPLSDDDRDFRANVGTGGQRFQGAQTVNVEELKKALLEMGMTIVPIGEKPLDPGGYAQGREQKILDLEAEVARFKDRALMSESAAASAIKELNELKEGKAQ